MRVMTVVCLLLMAACAQGPRGEDPGEAVRLAVEPETVQSGSSVELVLINGSDGAIRYNLCTSELQRRSGGGWEAVPTNRVCTMELRGLSSGSEARYRLELASGLPAGEYRFRTRVEPVDAGPATSVASPAFRVTRR